MCKTNSGTGFNYVWNMNSPFPFVKTFIED